jgi:hypothetical protein
VKLRLPAKQNLKAWQRLRSWFQAANIEVLAINGRVQMRKVRKLQREIARFEAMPENPAFAEQLNAMRIRLAQLTGQDATSV